VRTRFKNIRRQLRQARIPKITSNKREDGSEDAALAALCALVKRTRKVLLTAPRVALSRKGIGGDSQSVRSLVVLLKRNVNLNRLKLDDEGARILTDGLEGNTQLRTCMLDSNLIGNAGAVALARALPSMTELTHLSLASNMIGEVGAAALAQVLPSMASLTTLHLQSNSIGHVGAAALAQVLPSVSGLTELSLEYNEIGDVGAAALAQALPSMTNLTTLALGGNSIGDAAKAQLKAAGGPALKRLRL
jgi:Ran GTPase-activating protein (RanGAP) involved in mRNA processing and transport